MTHLLPPRSRALALTSLLALGACATASKQGTGPETLSLPQLREREALPDEAREMLHGRMLRHGDQLVYLVTSVLMLDYSSTARLADGLASEPRLGRPANGERDTLNALLPAAFFTYQEDLAKHARALGAAARAHDDTALADAFGAVTKTCVGCHSAYLDDDLGFPLHDEHDDDDGEEGRGRGCDPASSDCSAARAEAHARKQR